MPRHKNPYKEKWECEIDPWGVCYGEWLSKKEDYVAHCKKCNKDIYIGNMGKSAVIQHNKTREHCRLLGRLPPNAASRSTTITTSSSANDNSSSHLYHNYLSSSSSLMTVNPTAAAFTASLLGLLSS